MNKFFYLKEGSNKLKLITLPYQFIYHRHDKQIRMCFKSTFTCSPGQCELCLGQSKPSNLKSNFGMVTGVQPLDSDNKYIWHMSEAIWKNIIQLSLEAMQERVDPMQFEYDVVKEEKYIQIYRLNNIERVEDKEMTEKICQMIDAMFCCLKRKNDSKEFKNFFCICKNYSNELVNELYDTVEKDFPQKLDTLKTLLLFS